MEALCRGKNILVFGNAWYKDFPGVIKYNDSLTYEEIIKSHQLKIITFQISKIDGYISRRGY